MILYVTHRGLLYYALLDAGYMPVSVVQGIASMREPT